MGPTIQISRWDLPMCLTASLQVRGELSRSEVDVDLMMLYRLLCIMHEVLPRTSMLVQSHIYIPVNHIRRVTPEASIRLAV